MDSSTYVKWLEDGDKAPDWNLARVSEYFQDGSCMIIYDDSAETTVSETINLRTVDWLPYS